MRSFIFIFSTLMLLFSSFELGKLPAVFAAFSAIILSLMIAEMIIRRVRP